MLTEAIPPLYSLVIAWITFGFFSLVTGLYLCGHTLVYRHQEDKVEVVPPSQSLRTRSREPDRLSIMEL